MEAVVRKLAADLAAAIRDARREGYSVEWPSRPEDLDRIAISETGRVVTATVATSEKQYEVIGHIEPVSIASDPLPEELTAAPIDAPEPAKKPRFKPSAEQ